MINPKSFVKGYETGQVRRYHTHPRLAKMGQTDADHQWGVAVILMMLFPKISPNLLKEAITHDTGERFSADVSAPTKARYPTLKGYMAEIEEQIREKHLEGLGPFPLEGSEREALKLADMIECVMHVSIHDPSIIAEPAWEELLCEILHQAHQLDVEVQVQEILETAVITKGASEW